MKQIDARGRYELENGEIYRVNGFAPTHTYQFIGDGSAKLSGSMNSYDWTEIATFEATAANPDSLIGDHTWLYMKAEITGTAKLYGNRG